MTWLIAGETVSPDAVELIRKRKVFCSSIEQLVLLREMLGVSRPTNGEPGQPAMESTPEVTTRAPAERAGVVPLDRREANTELSSLRLPASQDSEYLAALVAEKLAVKGGFGENEAGKIKTSVLEGVLNAIEHSQQSREADRDRDARRAAGDGSAHHERGGGVRSAGRARARREIEAARAQQARVGHHADEALHGRGRL